MTNALERRRPNRPDHQPQAPGDVVQGYISQLTSLIDGYSGQWQRPLAEIRPKYAEAQALGEHIIYAAEQSWAMRYSLAMDILPALAVQDRKMYGHVRKILEKAQKRKEEREQPIREQLSRLEGIPGTSRERDTQLVTELGDNVVDLVTSHPRNYTFLYHYLRDLQEIDPHVHQWVVGVLHTSQAKKLQEQQSVVEKIPAQRLAPGAVAYQRELKEVES